MDSGTPTRYQRTVCTWGAELHPPSGGCPQAKAVALEDNSFPAPGQVGIIVFPG